MGFILFEVPTTYASSMEERAKVECSNTNAENVFWRKVWQIRGPPVVKLFLWKACTNSLATQDNLHRRNITRNSLCPICELEPETLGHILWKCGSAKDVWLESSRKLQKCSVTEEAFGDIFNILFKKLDREEMQVFVTVACQIWLIRNAYVFGRPLLAPAEVIRRAKNN
jgi:hypothetical protein